MSTMENKFRNQQLALVNLRRDNASLRKALKASDKRLQEYVSAVVAWYENTCGETDVPEEIELIALARRIEATRLKREERRQPGFSRRQREREAEELKAAVAAPSTTSKEKE